MNIEDQVLSQVVSLELSQELKLLGVKKESLFYWLPIDYGSNKKARIVMKGGFNETYHDDAIPAFTASELLDMLPKEINGDDYELGCNFSKKMNYVFYYYENEIMDELLEQDENLCNATAKMLIHLIKRKIIEV